jgi:hypothetical protein
VRCSEAAQAYSDQPPKEKTPRAKHKATEDPFAMPDGGLCGFEFRLLGHGGDARGCSSRDSILQTRRVRRIGRDVYESMSTPCPGRRSRPFWYGDGVLV